MHRLASNRLISLILVNSHHIGCGALVCNCMVGDNAMVELHKLRSYYDNKL